jgi:hypothetical protein
MPINHQELHRFLNRAFNREELDTLCFDLGIDYRRLASQRLSERAKELIDIIARQGRTPQLLDLLRRERLRLFGESGPAQPTPPLPSTAEVLALDRVGLRRLLSARLTNAHIRALGAERGLDVDQLPVYTRPGKARELIVFLEDQGRLGELRQRLARHVSGEDPIIPQEPSQAVASEPVAGSGAQPPPDPSSPLAERVAFYLDDQELRTLCFYLDLDYDELEGEAHLDRVQDLVNMCTKQGHLDRLNDLLKHILPKEVAMPDPLQKRWAHLTQPKWEWPQVPFEPELGTSERQTLIQLYQAMAQSCDEAQVDRLGRATLGQGYKLLKGEGQRGKTRELILALERRSRLPELVDQCQRLLGEFRYQDEEIDWLYQLPESASPVDEARLPAVLATRFSLDDLHQLCFYLGILFDDIMWWDNPSSWSEKTRQHFREVGIDYDQLSLAELNAALQERWVERFVAFCQEKGIWPQTVAVSFHLHPEAF